MTTSTRPVIPTTAPARAFAPASIARACARLFERLQPWALALFLLALRLLLADVFLRSGLLKLQSWDSTLTLFEHEYQVPLLPPALAAVLGTAGEVALPILLLAGLCSRFAAAGLFVVNLVAALSYPDLSPAGLKDHVLWGWWCAMLVVCGAGRLALDAWLLRRWRRGHSG